MEDELFRRRAWRDMQIARQAHRFLAYGWVTLCAVLAVVVGAYVSGGSAQPRIENAVMSGVAFFTVGVVAWVAIPYLYFLIRAPFRELREARTTRDHLRGMLRDHEQFTMRRVHAIGLGNQLERQILINNLTHVVDPFKALSDQVRGQANWWRSVEDFEAADHLDALAASIEGIDDNLDWATRLAQSATAYTDQRVGYWRVADSKGRRVDPQTIPSLRAGELAPLPKRVRP